MAIVIPSAESVNSLPIPLTEKQRIVAHTLLEVLHSHPPQPYPAVGDGLRPPSYWHPADCHRRLVWLLHPQPALHQPEGSYHPAGRGEDGATPKAQGAPCTGRTTGHRLQRLRRPLAPAAPGEPPSRVRSARNFRRAHRRPGPLAMGADGDGPGLAGLQPPPSSQGNLRCRSGPLHRKANRPGCRQGKKRSQSYPQAGHGALLPGHRPGRMG